MEKKLKNLNTWALAALLIAVTVLLNWVVGLVGTKVGLQIDLTENGDYQISAESRAFIAEVAEPIKVYVLAEELLFKSINQYFYQINEALQSYGRLNSNIEVEYVSLLKNPAFKNSYARYKLYDNDIVVVMGDKSVHLGPEEIFLTQVDAIGQETVTSSRFESAFATALLELQSDERILVSFLRGHGEDEITAAALASLFNTNNVSTTLTNLYLENLSADVNVVVVAGPLVDYDQEIIEKLRTFLTGGGQILYFADSAQPELPNLENFLRDHGIDVGGGTVFESDTRLMLNYNAYFSIVEYLENAYSAELAEKNIPCTAPYARPLSEVPTDNAHTVSILRFSGASGIVPPDAPANWEYTPADIVGYISAAIESNTATGGRIVAFGSLAFVDESLLQTTSLGNAKYLLNVLFAIVGRPDAVSIAPKSIEMPALFLTTASVNLLGILFIGVLPAAVLACGIVVYRKRKNS